MNKTINSILGLSAVGCLSTAHAVTILQFDSVTDTNITAATNNNAGTQLAQVANDIAFVSSSSATTFTDDVTLARTHLTQSTNVLGDNAGPGANDLAFSFGNSALANNSSDINSPFIGVNFVAAQDLSLTAFSLNTDPNNGTGLTGARDVTLFVSTDGGTTFTQFGEAINNGNNNLNTNIFTDSVSVLSGETVEFRAAFSDRTGFQVGNLQSFTRVGDFQISAEALVIPEPSSTALLGLGALGLLARRKR